MSQTLEPPETHAAHPGIPKDAGLFTRTIKTAAVQDAWLGAYFVLLALAIVFGSGVGRVEAIGLLMFDALLYVACLLLTRGGILRSGTLGHGLIYRFGFFGPLLLSYLHLRVIAPAVTSRAVDAQILAFDLAVFGVEPALAWDRFVTPATTEWFAFFYFLYFFLLSAHVLPMFFAAQSRRRLAHFALGILMVFCTGHLLYLVVPGWGPYRLLADRFAHKLEGGLFLRLVLTTVEAGGAQKDIFPSLHTAAPTFLATFAFLNRRAVPWRYTWWVMAFIASQIIVATMFLRWHYLIDIFAGLTLAVTSAVTSRAVVRWEDARRRRLGLPPVFELLPWPRNGGNGDGSAKSAL